MGRFVWRGVCRGRIGEILDNKHFVWVYILSNEVLIVRWSIELKLLCVPICQFKFYFMYSNFLLNMII